jgi:hypothetical protein
MSDEVGGIVASVAAEKTDAGQRKAIAGRHTTARTDS